MRIYLVGFMACGKSSVGERLAERLGYKLLDLDTCIEDAAGMTIPEIFAKKDENTFRVIEREVLHATFDLDNVVIATGGGAPCFFDNMEAINQHGYSFYLRKSVDFLVDKLLQAKIERPLVQGKSEQQLREYIEETLGARRDFYNKAQFVLDTSDLKKKTAASLIAAMLKVLEKAKLQS